MHGVTSQKIASMEYESLPLITLACCSPWCGPYRSSDGQLLHNLNRRQTWQWVTGSTQTECTHTYTHASKVSLTFTIECRFVGERLWAPVTSMHRPIAGWHPLMGNLLHLVLATELENVLSVILQWPLTADKKLLFTKIINPLKHSNHIQPLSLKFSDWVCQKYKLQLIN